MARRTGEEFATCEHPLEPGTLGAPPHTHENEDEISFVVEGRIAVLLGEEVHEVEAGGYVLKPRGVPRAFWNPGPGPARVVEIISPAGFERYFEELAARYGLTFHWERVEEISRRYNVAPG